MSKVILRARSAPALLYVTDVRLIGPIARGNKRAMKAVKQTKKLVKTVRVDVERIEALLDRLEAANQSPSTERRKQERYDYRTQTIVHIQQPGDSHFRSYVVPTRNLSEGGMSFLFGGFVHIGASCIIQLTTPNRIWREIPGKVVSCRYVEGNIHEVMACFDKPIDASAYCLNAPCGCVLLAEHDPAISRLATFHLKALNICVDHATNEEEVIDKAFQRKYDFILMDMEMPEVDGFKTVETLKQKGYMGKIVATTGLTQPESRSRCLSAGCDYYLPKPYVGKDLAKIITPLQDQPIYSTFLDDASMDKIISEFVVELPSKIRSIQEALLKEDNAGLLSLVRDIKGEGSGYGFAVISEVAAEVENVLLANNALDDAREAIDRLVKLCLRARPNPQIGGICPARRQSKTSD